MSFWDWYASKLTLPKVFLQTADDKQPWVVYTYGRTHDRWLHSPWRNSLVVGRIVVDHECAVCGAHEVAILRAKRFSRPSEDPFRREWLKEHVHPDMPNQAAWAKPLLNPFALGALDLDLLVMRLEADALEFQRQLKGEDDVDA